jgi:hypothetical protein
MLLGYQSVYEIAVEGSYLIAILYSIKKIGQVNEEYGEQEKLKVTSLGE